MCQTVLNHSIVETNMDRHKRVRACLRHGLLAVWLSVAGSVSAAAAQLQLPAITEPASQEHHVGKIIFAELVTPDLAAAKRFYGRLFGWTFRDIDAGGTVYAEAMLSDRPVAGLLQKELPAGGQRQPAWLSYFSVRDVDAAERAALQNGAKVLFGPRSFPDRGTEAVFADPQGAVFAVLASSSGDPPDLMADAGEWIWSALITTDPDTDAGFYKLLFGYDVFQLPGQAGAQHLMLACDGYARASVNSPAANRPNFHPHWLNFVRVENATAMAARVVALGGNILVEPRVDRHGGKIALVADPQGAPFGLLEWPANESREMSR